MQLIEPAVEIESDARLLGRAVVTLRERAGLSPRTLARLAELDRPQLDAIERGALEPGFTTLLQIAAGLDLPISYLMLAFESEAYLHVHGPLEGSVEAPADLERETAQEPRKRAARFWHRLVALFSRSGAPSAHRGP